ncbi:MAG: hypothetical protein WBA10_17225 [Elainellaceae cyanobacterium]
MDSTANSTFLGTNLMSVADWATQYPFMDYFKSSRDWLTHTDSTWNTKENDKLQLDDDGWVTSLDGGQFTSVGTLLPNDNQGRRFVVLYEGEGTIQYRDGAQKDSGASKPGRDVFYAKPGENINLRITETDPSGSGDYLRNIRVVPEEHEAIAGQTFNPDFLKSLEGYETLRFMDWMETNDSDQSRWGNRPDANDSEYYGQGVPVEVMVELANETGIDPWFTLPHKATDDYVRNFAEYVKENLDPGLKVHVEFSNEVWNGQFEQARYAKEQGNQAFSTGSDSEKRQKWFGQRTGEITQIWDDVFGADKGRVIGVLGAQAANPNTAEKSLEALQATGKSYQELGIDAIAIAPYFGGYIGSPKYQSQVQSWTRDADGGMGKLFKEITQGGVLDGGPEGGAIQLAKDWMDNYATLADKAGLDLVAYEGGQHLVGHSGVENNSAITNLFIKANRDPRIGEAYKEYFDTWQAVSDGGTFANYSDIYKAGKYGSWGIRESLYQDSSPKFNAVQDILQTTGASPESTPPMTDPAPPVVESAPDAEDVPDEVAPDDIISEDTVTDKPIADKPVADKPIADMGDDANGDAADPSSDDAIDPAPPAGEDGPDAGQDMAPDTGSGMTPDGGSNAGQDMAPDASAMNPIRVEAEDMTLEGYRLEANDKVSGKQVISFRGGATDESGTASQTFDGPSGTYDVVVSYVDETDGMASLEARLNGETLEAWQLSETLGSAAISSDNQVQRTVATGVTLEAGDTFELRGQEQSFEHARVDYVEFVPVGIPAANDAPPNASDDAPSNDGMDDTVSEGPTPGTPQPEMPAPANPVSDSPMPDLGSDMPSPSLTLAQSPVSLSGNTLKSIRFDYAITPDTMMQLEFRSSGEGSIQAIGFDQDVFISESDRQNMVKLSGTENWSVAEDVSDQVTAAGWQTLDVAIGQVITGDYDHLSLLNIDGGQADLTGEFRNIKLFEAPMGAMTSERGSAPFDDTAAAENPLAALTPGEEAMAA